MNWPEVFGVLLVTQARGKRLWTGVRKGEPGALPELLERLHGIDDSGDEKRGGVMELLDEVSGASTDEEVLPLDADDEMLLLDEELLPLDVELPFGVNPNDIPAKRKNMVSNI